MDFRLWPSSINLSNFCFILADTIANKLHLQKISDFELSPGDHPCKVEYPHIMCVVLNLVKAELGAIFLFLLEPCSGADPLSWGSCFLSRAKHISCSLMLALDATLPDAVNCPWHSGSWHEELTTFLDHCTRGVTLPLETNI